MNLRFLHFSDLHICKKDVNDIKKRIIALKSDLEIFKNDKNMSPDLIFFTGDLISKGKSADEEFRLANDIFIQPLLEYTRLTFDDIYFVPGNHEVDQTITSEILEEGYQKKLVTLDSFNAFYDSIRSNEIEFDALKKKLAGYNNFVDGMVNKHLLKKDFFYRSYSTNIKNCKLGIVCLNSSWLASQYLKENSNVIIGEKVFAEAYSEIQDCDIKIALSHHGFDMLNAWDKKSIINNIAKNIDIYLVGHVHDSDFVYVKPIYGSLNIITCASLYKGKYSDGYTFCDIDMSSKKLNIWLRKYYQNRGEYDQETDKCKNGIIVIDNFKFNNSNTDYLISMNLVKSKIQEYQNSISSMIVHPFDGLRNINLNEVFVEPMISAVSCYEDILSSNIYVKLDEIVKDNSNCIFYGRKEFGKTTLLKYIHDKVLGDQEYFESKIPVLLNFNELPVNNIHQFTSLIRKKYNFNCTNDEIDTYLKNGDVIIIIDDYDDYYADNKEDKKKILREIIQKYSSCRIILSYNDNLAQKYKNMSDEVLKSFLYKKYYLVSLSTARVRQILEKWRHFNSYDTEKMLRQILFHFKHLRIPITPMAVTLLIGALVRDTANKNIYNEAYLIENYLEALLEKSSQTEPKQQLDFKEKESFLAHLAYRMYQNKRWEFNLNEYEREKLEYFDNYDEDVPPEPVFDVFYKKGILVNNNQNISFKFRFLFFFFLAKAMQKDKEKMFEVLRNKTFLKYATALAYKSGLDRGDLDLLTILDEYANKEIQELIKQQSTSNLEDYEISDGLIKYSEELEKEIIKKNKIEEKDDIRDSKYLDYNDEDQEIEITEGGEEGDDELNDDIFNLITLNSDVIRNTREIKNDAKRKYLSRNVMEYKNLMWLIIETIIKSIEALDKEEIERMIYATSNKDKKINVEYEIKKMKEFIVQIMPESVLLYMCEHLPNYRLRRTIKYLYDTETSYTNKLFYVLLLFKSDTSYINDLSNYIKSTNSYLIDFIVYFFIKIYCQENKVDEKLLGQIMELLEEIRKKHSKTVKTLPGYMRDSFQADFRKDILKNKKNEQL